MPNYDYGCTECDHEFEVSHGMNDTPTVECPECGSPAKKMISACGFIIHNTGAVNAARERQKSERDARSDLLENYGVEKVSPMPGVSFDRAYKDVKDQGTLVRDQMQQTREENAAKTKAKQREWAIKANKRAPRTAKIKEQKRAEEAAAKRAIRL